MTISKVSAETLASNILTALTVHAFENDANAERALRDQHKALTNMLKRYIEPKPLPKVAAALKGVTPPETITFTGLNPTANFDEVRAISEEYPQVEWAVLVKDFAQGGRFPSHDWITATAAWCRMNGVKVAAHLCGSWALSALVEPELIARYLPLHLGAISRVQINAWRPGLDVQRLAAWSLQHDLPIIVQWPGDDFPDERGVLWLADKSRGEGVRRINWPEPVGERLFGFAGGIGPDNVVDVVRAIGKNPGRYWIDMESSMFEGDTFVAARARQVCEGVFGPSPQEVPRLRDALLRIGAEIEPTRQYAEELGLSGEFGGSAVHIKLSQIESIVAQALGVKSLRDAVTPHAETSVVHAVGVDPHFIGAGSTHKEVEAQIEDMRL